MTAPLRERLREWRALERARPSVDDPFDRRVRPTTVFIRQCLGASVRRHDAEVRVGKRVHGAGSAADLHDIDVVVVTPKCLHLVTLKGWRGRIEDWGSRWLEIDTLGQRREHLDPVAAQADARAAVIAQLSHQGLHHNLETLERYVATRVLFASERVELCDSVRAHPAILATPGFDAFLEESATPDAPARALALIADRCRRAEEPTGIAGRSTLTESEFAAVVACVDAFPSWDRLQLYGGRQVMGELHRLRLGGEAIPRRQLTPPGRLALRWTRGFLPSLFKAATGASSLGELDVPGQPSRPLAPSDEAIFQPVHENVPTSFPLARVEEILLG